MNLFNTEQLLIANALRVLLESPNLAPTRVERPVEARVIDDKAECGNCADLTPKTELERDQHGFNICPKCAPEYNR